MPDLLTHYAAARVPGTALRDPRVLTLFVLGTFLPDLAAKGIYWVAWAANDFEAPTHSAVGLLPLCYLAALFVREGLRGPAFGALYAGGLLHVAVDLVKDNLGTGSALVFYPFTTAAPELGWIHSENVVLLAPLNLAVLAAVALAERRFPRVRR